MSTQDELVVEMDNVPYSHHQAWKDSQNVSFPASLTPRISTSLKK